MNQVTLAEEYKALKSEYIDFLESLSVPGDAGHSTDDISLKTLEKVEVRVRLSAQGWEVSCGFYYYYYYSIDGVLRK